MKGKQMQNRKEPHSSKALDAFDRDLTRVTRVALGKNGCPCCLALHMLRDALMLIEEDGEQDLVEWLQSHLDELRANIDATLQ